ncbi:hypothetical protein AeMF1_002101 [Aphanomyces euteiches]|nr:hypothetical protein AeMF1_002101 [Aphanomyces euteiches]KAH9191517.1 hypothetical protein AeNC1_006511 [Aphanomyces euteiches]
MFALQRQVKVLKAKLEAAKEQAVVPREMSTWEKAARIQLFQKQQALHENEHLREAADENNYFIAKMKSFISKKPRLSAKLTSDEWQEYRLAARASLRAAGVHAIADRQYHRLDTALINAGAWGLKENLFSVRTNTKNGGTVFSIEYVQHVKLNTPRSVVGNAAWSVYHDPEMQLPVPAGAQRTIEMIDHNTMYEMYEEQTSGGLSYQSNMVRKSFTGENRHVVLSRAVLEDALAPHMIHGNVEDESIWIVVETDETNPNQCYFTMLCNVQTDLSQITMPEQFDLDGLVEHLKKLAISMNHEGQGLISQENKNVNWNDFPPSASTFARNGKKFEQHLFQVINQAVESYQATKIEAT